jgi:hypothetical protein
MMTGKTLRQMVLAGCVAMASIGWAGGAMAQDEGVAVVSHVKVMSDKNTEDVTSPEAWKASVIKPGMTDQEKAIAVWRTVTKYRHQASPPDEGSSSVHDPIKTFNVYGYGQCCCASSDIEGLARYIGMPARGRIINNHSVPEVWYDGAWHLLDSSLMFYLVKPDGKIASVDEMKQSIEDWLKDHPELKTDADFKRFAKNYGWKKGPALFATCQFYDKNGTNQAKVHGWFSNMQEYNYTVGGEGRKIVVPPDTVGEVNVFDYGALMGYEVNVQLREGEKLTRNWSADEVATGLNAGKKFLQGDRSELGQQTEFGDRAPGRIGNGTLEYDVMADSKLASDALTFENLKMDGGKLRVVDAGKPGVLVVRMPSSYLYLGGDMAIQPTIGNGGTVKASVSLNNGLDWMDLAKIEKGGEQKVDLKPMIWNRYDYRLKLELSGGPGIDALKLTNKIQCSQAPLPVIVDGENKLTFTADKVAEGTVTVEGDMAGKPSRRTGMAPWIGDFHPTVNGASVKRFAIGTTQESDDKAGVPGTDILSIVVDPPKKGFATVPVTAPGEITRVRLGVHWRARNPADGYTVLGSFDDGKTWKEMGKLGQANPAKSTYLVYSDVPAGAKTVLVKFDGVQKNATEIFDLRIDVDYKEPAGGLRPVKVTYNWEENGTPKSAQHVCATSGDTWTIPCGKGTVVKSYSVELAK